jgi:hypothetical protein
VAARPAKPGKKRSRRTSVARSGAVLREAAPQTLDVTFVLRDVASQPIHDPETFFTFRRLSDSRQIGDQIAQAVAGAPVSFDVPVAAGQVLVCEIDPKRFRFAHSPVFFGAPGPPVTREAQLLREPNEWTPRFTRWADLPASFDALKKVLRDSPNVELFKDDTGAIADLLVGAAYDGMSGDKVALAKTALLNTYYRLSRTMEPVSGSRSWFSFVSRIHAIGRERFLAIVDPAMQAIVEQIDRHIDEFRADYEPTPAGNHRGNVPGAWQNRIAKMVSIKSAHRKGNFQLTLTELTGPDEVLLDADVDESGDLLGHFADLFKHKISGGTHPHDVHEILVFQGRDTEDVELGYRLV